MTPNGTLDLQKGTKSPERVNNWKTQKALKTKQNTCLNVFKRLLIV